MKKILMSSSNKQPGCLFLINNLVVYSLVVFVLMISFLPQAVAGSQDAINQLKAGNERYLENKSAAFIGAERRAETAKGQYPFCSILSCSDSRVPPEIIFDQGIGDLFVIRVAGNVADTDGVGSMEYSTDHLETNLIVVMGHTHCGAVKAALTDAKVDGNIVSVVEKIVPAIQTTFKNFPAANEKELMKQAVRENVLQAIRDIIAQSPVLRARYDAGILKIKGAIYDIETGKVEWLKEIQ